MIPVTSGYFWYFSQVSPSPGHIAVDFTRICNIARDLKRSLATVKDVYKDVYMDFFSPPLARYDDILRPPPAMPGKGCTRGPTMPAGVGCTGA
ncbi:MAG TPA: hypothetical protein GX506_06375 [Firmicutes bacterium]|nr:hypothetical protein [Bacillota bacterium]